MREEPGSAVAQLEARLAHDVGSMGDLAAKGVSARPEATPKAIVGSKKLGKNLRVDLVGLDLGGSRRGSSTEGDLA